MNCPICDKKGLSKHEELTQKCMVCEQKEWIKNLTPKDTEEILSWAENIDMTVMQEDFDQGNDDKVWEVFIEENIESIRAMSEQASQDRKNGNTYKLS